MARGTPIFLSGTIRPHPNNEHLDEFLTTIRRVVATYQSNGQQAWEVHTGTNDRTALSGANSRETIFHSIGDRSLGSGSGDADIWLKMHHGAFFSGDGGTPTVYLTPMMDASLLNFSGTGIDAASFSSSQNFTLTQKRGIVWYAILNEYEVTMIWKQGVNYKMFSFGSLTRNVPFRQAGIARLRTATSGTGIVTLELDRDIRGTGSVYMCRPSQSVWLINQTVTGALDVPLKADLVTVIEVSSSYIIVSGVTNTPYQSGSLVGMEVQPSYAFSLIDNNSTSINMINYLDNTRSTSMQGIIRPFGIQTYEDYRFPDYSDLYANFYINIRQISGYPAMRGRFQFIQQFSYGTQKDEDLMWDDYENPQNLFMVFPSFTYSNVTDTTLGIGPIPNNLSSSIAF